MRFGQVYNISTNFSGIDPTSCSSGGSGGPGGSCKEASTWPFYLESYTAAAAIQAGFVEDGLALIEAIGLLNLRLGLGWAQDLWNPGFLTYVTAPVTWFVPDVLGAFALDASNRTLFLSPTLWEVESDGGGRVSLPMYFPQFWAVVEASADGSGGGALSVKVVKHFGAPVVIERIVAQPVGKATRDGAAVELAEAFSCATGAVLGLGEHWGSIVQAELQGRVLPSEPPTGRPG